MTPIGVAMTTSRNASFMLCWSAPRRLGSWNTELMSGAVLVYHLVVKPCHTVSDRLLLNENWMATSTGAIDHTMYVHVTTTRNRGLPHGLVIQPRRRRQVLNSRASVLPVATAWLMPAGPSTRGGSSTCSSPSAGRGRARAGW